MEAVAGGRRKGVEAAGGGSPEGAVEEEEPPELERWTGLRTGAGAAAGGVGPWPMTDSAT